MRRLFWIVLLSQFLACKPTGRSLAPTDTQSGPWEYPISVEEGKLDNGALACAADVLKPVTTHNDTKTAFDNLANTSSDTIVIVGHGATGMICTADGDTCTSYIGEDNEKDWADLITGIQKNTKIKTIRLLGCGVGFDAPGRKLLQAIARNTGHTVLAPTSVVYCTNNGVKLDQYGRWVQEPPVESMAASKTADEPSFSTQWLDLGETAKPRFVPWKKVKVTNFSVLESYAGAQFADLPSAEAIRLAREINFGAQFDPHGQPLARLTGRLTLELNFGLPISKTFLVYGDMVVRDEEDAKHFYRVSKAFTYELIARRRRKG